MPILSRPNQPDLHYVVDDYTDPWKNAPTIILQHGFGRSSEMWYRWVPHLARHYKVVRPDIRGLGQSSRSFDLSTGMSVEAFVQDLQDLIAAVDHRPVHYCGESLGGMLGVALAAQAPHLLRTLSLIAAPLRISQATQKTFACGMADWQTAIRTLGTQDWAHSVNGSLRFPADADRGMQNWYADMMGKTHVDSLAALAGVAATADIEGLLGKVQTSTLAIYPTGGSITGPDEEIVRTGIKNLRYVGLPSKYHAIQFLMAAECAKEVLHFSCQHDGFSAHE
ncbi:MAG: alpha/beta fold hydrolase [Comamonadaceae bacterium]|nr:alpha/beta fold hydrolase [Comamonadaceae bacterium]